MDENSLEQCVNCKDLIKNLSIERISSEMNKILGSNYPSKILSTMQNHGILQEIFMQELNLESLEIFYSIKNYLNFESSHVFSLALILSRNKMNYNLMLLKKERKYIYTILSNIPKNIDNNEIKKLLFLLGDKVLVKSIVIVYFCANFHNFLELKKYLDYIDKTEIPQLNITGNDLIENDFKDRKNYSDIIARAGEIFVDSGFKYSKNKIIRILKREVV